MLKNFLHVVDDAVDYPESFSNHEKSGKQHRWYNRQNHFEGLEFSLKSPIEDLDQEEERKELAKNG